MRDLDRTTARELARQWSNDYCPALAAYALSGQICPGLVGEIDYLLARQVKLMRTSVISKPVLDAEGRQTGWTPGLNMAAAEAMEANLVTFRRMVEEKLRKADELTRGGKE